MTIVIEIDKQWTVGVDNFKYVKGLRLGFIAAHIVFGQVFHHYKKDGDNL